MLLQTIESVNKQDFDLSQVEIIVVSQTPSIQEVEFPTLNVDLSVIIRPESDTISALRNYGVKESSGEYLAFLDADIYLSANWIQSMLSELQSTSSRIITSAVQICEPSAPSLEKIRTHLSNAEIDVDVNFLPGRNLFMTTESFHKVGGFPEHLVTCEDYFFTDKAAKLGSLFYTSKANYIHLGEDKELGSMFSKEIWRGQSNLQSLQGRNIPLREWPSLIVPPAIFACLISACFFLLLGLQNASLTFLLLALIPVTAYTLRLWRIAKSDVTIGNILLFYACYFPARALGTFVGVFKTIKVK
ncbi:glycosyltransferase family 2 protein [Paraglaciecola aquimarina]|uniref:Glycosyltransferase family 2 protein n=2 Tax=Paraglaciecola algarum TaxID=3050085 RepID=A0ABS9D7U6_9ALTE|nr:glycosyltransferase family 2 protein [Paraglaciecola sp. G1-23]